MTRVLVQGAGASVAALLALMALGAWGSADEPPDCAAGQDGKAAASTLVCVSDYVSFVGEDAGGHVAFALDTNRGRDGDAYQAEHFVVLHDERRGWVQVLGSGRYENAKRELVGLPDSPAFSFAGTPATGLTITSQANGLALQVEPIAVALSRQNGRSEYRLGSALAVLRWSGRTVSGRVIHEFLCMPRFNRLTRTYWGLWKDFQGLYLSVGGEGDLYAHRQASERIAALVGRVAGFVVWGGRSRELDGVTLTPLRRVAALGFYRWPVEWRLDWMGPDGPVSTVVRLTDRKVMGNWIIGGFAMGIVTGEITLEGRTHPVYGLAELLM